MRNCVARSLLVAAIGLLCASLQIDSAQSANPAGGTKNDWAYYGHDAGGIALGDELKIELDVSAIKAQEKAAG